MIRLRAVVFGAVLFGLVLALCGCFARGSNQAMVPSQAREAIVKDYPRMAFLPSRLPSGYHYANWTSCRNRLCYELTFRHGSGRLGQDGVGLGEPGKSRAYLDLQVERRSCPAPPKYPAKDTHTFHVNGHALKWLHASIGPLVWRCMANQGRSFVIFGFGGRSRQKLAEVAELVGYALPAH